MNREQGLWIPTAPDLPPALASWAVPTSQNIKANSWEAETQIQSKMRYNWLTVNKCIFMVLLANIQH